MNLVVLDAKDWLMLVLDRECWRHVILAARANKKLLSQKRSSWRQDDLCMHDNIQYDLFSEACITRNLLEDDSK